MLIIEPKEGGQDCNTCPFLQIRQTCLTRSINYNLHNQITKEFNCRLAFCLTHSITLKPEYNGMD